MSDEVSKLLKADLVRLGLTQEEFADKLGVTQQAVSAWCARNVIPHRRLKAIGDVLGSDSELVGYMRDNQPPVLLRDRSMEVREARERVASPPRVNKIVPTGPSNYSNIVRVWEEEQSRFRALIESHLPGARVEVDVTIGNSRRQFDYVSDSLCLDLILSPTADGRNMLHSSRVYTRLVALLLFKKANEDKFPKRHYGIIAIDYGVKLNNSYFSKLQWECEQFDVSLRTVPDIEAAADFIIRIEDNLSDGAGHDYEAEL